MRAESPNPGDQRPVHVIGLFEMEGSQENGTYSVLLRDDAGRSFHILVDACAAFAIRMALDDSLAALQRRPFTHDLMQQLLSRLHACLESVLIDDVSERTYFAKLVISRPQGRVQVDARPSDAIALALRAGAPIYAHESVITRTQRDEGEPTP